MVSCQTKRNRAFIWLSVLALSSRFDGPTARAVDCWSVTVFQYSLCRVVLMVDGTGRVQKKVESSFSTRSVESF